METRTHRPFRIVLLAALTAAMMIAACGAPAPTPSPTERPALPPTNPAVAPTDSPTSVPPSPTAAATSAAPAIGPVSFSRDLLPLFNNACIKCHGGDKTEKGLDMKSYASLLAGSERGAVVVPGNSSKSRLAQLVINGKMPKRGEKLSSEQVQLIVDWINAGAQNN